MTSTNVLTDKGMSSAASACSDMAHSVLDTAYFDQFDKDGQLTKDTNKMADPNIGAILTGIKSLGNQIGKINEKLDGLKCDNESNDNRLSIVEDTIEHVQETCGVTGYNTERLHKEIELLKAIVIRQDEQMAIMNKRIISQEAISMSYNVLFHNVPETQQSDNEAITNIMKQLGLQDIPTCDKIHRGAGPVVKHQPRIIYVKFQFYQDAAKVINAGRSLPTGKGKLRITPQFPLEWVHSRREMSRAAANIKASNPDARIRISKDRMYVNNSQWNKPIHPPSARTLLDTQQQDKPQIRGKGTSQLVIEKGSSFQATSLHVSTIKDVQTAYNILCSDPDRARCTHNICVYGIPTKKGSLNYGYEDHGEFGAGANTIRKLTAPGATLPDNAKFGFVSVISRAYGGTHLGPQRFDIIHDVLLQSLHAMTPPSNVSMRPNQVRVNPSQDIDADPDMDMSVFNTMSQQTQPHGPSSQPSTSHPMQYTTPKTTSKKRPHSGSETSGGSGGRRQLPKSPFISWSDNYERGEAAARARRGAASPLKAAAETAASAGSPQLLSKTSKQLQDTGGLPPPPASS